MNDLSALMPTLTSSTGSKPFSPGGTVDDADFGSHLDRAAREQRAREAAAQFVGSAFIQPLLAQLHESPFAAGPFAPNEAERRFAPIFDQVMSDRIAKATNFALTDAVAQRLLRTAEGAPVMPREHAIA